MAEVAVTVVVAAVMVAVPDTAVAAVIWAAEVGASTVAVEQCMVVAVFTAVPPFIPAARSVVRPVALFTRRWVARAEIFRGEPCMPATHAASPLRHAALRRMSAISLVPGAKASLGPAGRAFPARAVKVISPRATSAVRRCTRSNGLA